MRPHTLAPLRCKLQTADEVEQYIPLSLTYILFLPVPQVWIGTKQKELEAGSMQLMHQYTPWATGLLAVLVPVFEPVGFMDRAPGTILGYNYTFITTTAILGSAVSCLPLQSAWQQSWEAIACIRCDEVTAGSESSCGEAMQRKVLLSTAPASLLAYADAEVLAL